MIWPATNPSFLFLSLVLTIYCFIYSLHQEVFAAAHKESSILTDRLIEREVDTSKPSEPVTETSSPSSNLVAITSATPMGKSRLMLRPANANQRTETRWYSSSGISLPSYIFPTTTLFLTVTTICPDIRTRYSIEQSSLSNSRSLPTSDSSIAFLSISATTTPTTTMGQDARIFLQTDGCQTIIVPTETAICNTKVAVPGQIPLRVTACDQWITFSTTRSIEGCTKSSIVGSTSIAVVETIRKSKEPKRGQDGLNTTSSSGSEHSIICYAAHWYDLVKSEDKIPEFVRVEKCDEANSKDNQELSTVPVYGHLSAQLSITRTCQTAFESWTLSYNTEHLISFTTVTLSDPPRHTTLPITSLEVIPTIIKYRLGPTSAPSSIGGTTKESATDPTTTQTVIITPPPSIRRFTLVRVSSLIETEKVTSQIQTTASPYNAPMPPQAKTTDLVSDASPLPTDINSNELKTINNIADEPTSEVPHATVPASNSPTLTKSSTYTKHLISSPLPQESSSETSLQSTPANIPYSISPRSSTRRTLSHSSPAIISVPPTRSSTILTFQTISSEITNADLGIDSTTTTFRTEQVTSTIAMTTETRMFLTVIRSLETTNIPRESGVGKGGIMINRFGGV